MRAGRPLLLNSCGPAWPVLYQVRRREKEAQSFLQNTHGQGQDRFRIALCPVKASVKASVSLAKAS